MNIKYLTLGPIQANCYIICDEKTKIGAVIDPGDFSAELINVIEKTGVEKLAYIMCTHGHFDHVSGVGRLKEKYPDAKVVIGSGDAPCLGDGELNEAKSFGLQFYPCEADKTVDDGDVFTVGDIEFSVMSAQGHTQGGVVYVCADEGVIFTGDTLFCRSVGRTDLLGGNMQQLFESLKRIRSLPVDWVVYSGHGEATTIGNEIRFNPYFKMIR